MKEAYMIYDIDIKIFGRFSVKKKEKKVTALL